MEHWRSVGAFSRVRALLERGSITPVAPVLVSLLIWSILFSLFGLSCGIQLFSLGLPSNNISLLLAWLGIS